MATKGSTKSTVKHRGWVVRILLIALALFLFFKAVQLYGQLKEKQLALAELENRIVTQKVINEGLQDKVDNVEDYLEHEANENDYYFPGQQIFQNEAG